MSEAKVEKRHRDKAKELYEVAGSPAALAQALATAEQQGKEAGRAWVPGQPLWDWEPWARFLGARAQLIHAAVAEGQPVAEIREWLSMDEGQVRLIAASNLDGVAGIPGKVWPPPSNPEGAK